MSASATAPPDLRHATVRPAAFGRIGPICVAAALAAALLVPNRPAAVRADSGGHPSDPWFALDHVLDVAIEMAPDDWRLLRGQKPIIAGRRGGADCRTQPFAEPYSWFAADVIVDGQRYGAVGVRKRGFIGSVSFRKPSLKLDFDKYVDDQALGGVLRRINLNNSVQDPTLLNTCLAYYVFAAAGLPAPRCNYARVAVNGRELGLYVHVEDIERSLLKRSFADSGGNLYEGTFSDFRPEFRGTFEKETKEDAADWSDVDAVVSALQDQSAAGLKALAAAVDLDRFLTFWAAEVLVGHMDGYVEWNNNYHFYREPGGRFVFIPWGTDRTFGPWLPVASGAIAHRLYGDPAWREAFATRLREMLDTVWDETELLRRSQRVAVIVQAHLLAAERRAETARGADRVRRFIRERRAEVLAALESESLDGGVLRPPSEWWCWGEPTSIELRFETSWGRSAASWPAIVRQGTVTRYLLNGTEQAVGPSGVTAGLAGPEAPALPGGSENLVVITLMAMGSDSTIRGVTAWLQPRYFYGGSGHRIDRRPAKEKEVARRFDAITWLVRPGATKPEHVIPFRTATLELYDAGMQPGAAVSGRFEGVLWSSQPPAGAPLAIQPQVLPSLIINEVAARGEPRDWFEIYNASGVPLALGDFTLADDLTDRSRRFPFLPGRIEPGAYLRVELDSDRWPGFALGRDEELGIWTWYGRPVAQVDWQAGDAGRGMSYARVPDLTGPFRTVAEPTPGAPNAGAMIDLTLAQPPIVRVWSALAAISAGERGAPAARSPDWDLYLDAAGTELTYHKEPCAPEDLQERFHLRVFPADLPTAGSQASWYHTFPFAEHGLLRGGACVALVPLPSYERGSARIRTGQFNGWRVEFPGR